MKGRNGSIPEADQETTVNSESLQSIEETERRVGRLEGERNLVMYLGICRAGGPQPICQPHLVSGKAQHESGQVP